uniref:Serine-threonine/tyrosine-protein kinase catalytic domain-containing protein n=1 Tax=Quercus lobata TaxID=97700 RepID=A0A7N2LL64_QUELO
MQGIQASFEKIEKVAVLANREAAVKDIQQFYTCLGLTGGWMSWQSLDPWQPLPVKILLNTLLLQVLSLWNSIMGMIKVIVTCSMILLTEKRNKMEKAMQVFESKEEYFIHNGAILLEKQISCNQGKLDDWQVAIKVKGPLRLWSFEKTIDFFLNQVAIKQLISNKNVLRLYGCCLETEIPILVFDLISDNTLFDNLHGKGKWVPLLISWLDRVRIAMETSYAICYMHCGRSRPIVHLDKSFTAKLSNFGFAVSIAPGERLFSSYHQVFCYDPGADSSINNSSKPKLAPPF